VQVVCHILLESSRQGIQLCFRSHLNWRFGKTIYGLPKLQESQFREFQDSQVGSLETKWHLGAGPMAMHREYYKGKVVASPKSELWWVLWVCVC
jgi:hypothetical protein